MRLKPVIIGTVAYLFVTFPLAIIWHVVLFKSMYEQLGYFGSEPKFILGFIAILIQGFVLSYVYGLINMQGSPTAKGLKYAAIIGLFHWTIHVLAFAAKNAESNTAMFYIFESIFLSLQFGIYGLIIGNVYQRQSPGHCLLNT